MSTVETRGQQTVKGQGDVRLCWSHGPCNNHRIGVRAVGV